MYPCRQQYLEAQLGDGGQLPLFSSCALLLKYTTNASSATVIVFHIKFGMQPYSYIGYLLHSVLAKDIGIAYLQKCELHAKCAN